MHTSVMHVGGRKSRSIDMCAGLCAPTSIGSFVPTLDMGEYDPSFPFVALTAVVDSFV